MAHIAFETKVSIIFLHGTIYEYAFNKKNYY